MVKIKKLPQGSDYQIHSRNFEPGSLLPESGSLSTEGCLASQFFCVHIDIKRRQRIFATNSAPMSFMTKSVFHILKYQKIMCVVTITLLLICFPSNFSTGNITDNGNESYGDSAGNIRCDTTRQRPLGQNENSGVGGRSAGSDCQGATRGGRVKYGGPQGDTAGASGQTSGPGRGDQSADRTQGHSQDPA